MLEQKQNQLCLKDLPQKIKTKPVLGCFKQILLCSPQPQSSKAISINSKIPLY